MPDVDSCKQSLGFAAVLFVLLQVVKARAKQQRAPLPPFVIPGLFDVLTASDDAGGLSIVNLGYIQPTGGAAGTPNQVLGLNSTGEMRWLTPTGIMTPGLFEVLTNSDDAGQLAIVNLRRLAINNPQSAGNKEAILVSNVVSSSGSVRGVDLQNVAAATNATGFFANSVTSSGSGDRARGLHVVSAQASSGIAEGAYLQGISGQTFARGVLVQGVTATGGQASGFRANTVTTTGGSAHGLFVEGVTSTTSNVYGGQALTVTTTGGDSYGFAAETITTTSGESCGFLTDNVQSTSSKASGVRAKATSGDVAYGVEIEGVTGTTDGVGVLVDTVSGPTANGVSVSGISGTTDGVGVQADNVTGDSASGVSVSSIAGSADGVGVLVDTISGNAANGVSVSGIAGTTDGVGVLVDTVGGVNASGISVSDVEGNGTGRSVGISITTIGNSSTNNTNGSLGVDVFNVQNNSSAGRAVGCKINTVTNAIGEAVGVQVTTVSTDAASGQNAFGIFSDIENSAPQVRPNFFCDIFTPGTITPGYQAILLDGINPETFQINGGNVLLINNDIGGGTCVLNLPDVPISCNFLTYKIVFVNTNPVDLEFTTPGSSSINASGAPFSLNGGGNIVAFSSRNLTYLRDQSIMGFAGWFIDP